MSNERPVPRNEEIELDNTKYIESETDTKGIITDANDYFCEISGYKKEELIGQPHNIVRHPDMPKIAFKLVWDRIKSGKNINAAIKNLAKDGRYYWVFTHFEIIRDINTKEITGYRAYRKAVSRHVKEILDPLYKKLVELEKEGGMEASEKYLNEVLAEAGEEVTFDNLLEEIHRLY
ncbi:PAS domain-containing protein [Hydrogenimonas sp.]|uniref:PAS domain-containing protein n=1 Tax=Hydrogenimonas sp. TaxID=2231112 RepID=UPI002608DF60|nr:PAS domain-containing protein [Hydrogenimonas sp.]